MPFYLRNFSMQFDLQTVKLQAENIAFNSESKHGFHRKKRWIPFLLIKITNIKRFIALLTFRNNKSTGVTFKSQTRCDFKRLHKI